MQDCIFCKIVKHEISSKPIYEDDICYAFYDLEPQAPIHFLVVPKQHIESALQITKDNLSIIGHCYYVISKIAKDMNIESYRVVNNCGEQAGQSVFHIHFHVLSGRDMKWPPG